MMEHLELSIDELLLDRDNPRLGSVQSQSEALASLVRLSPGHFRNLMASIRDDGLDPGDSLYVVRSEDGQDFVVLEGNRRLSALKVLANPDVLAGTDLSDSEKRPLVQEATGFEPSQVEPIRCVRFDERDEANDWIRRRHTGVKGGEGRINWKPLEIQRFSGDYSTIDVIEFVGRNAGYSKGGASASPVRPWWWEVHEPYATVGVRAGAVTPRNHGAGRRVPEDPGLGS